MSTLRLFRLVSVLLGCWLAAFSAAHAADPAVRERIIRVGIGLNADTPQGKGVLHFAERVRVLSGGRMQVELSASGKLGDDLTMVGALRAGKQDMTCPDSSTLATLVKDFSAVNYPFTFIDETEADNLLDGPWGQRLLSKLPEHGLVGLAFWENGFRNITNSKRALNTAQDFEGLRIRTMQNPMLVQSFGKLGFTAIPMPFPKVFSALQTGEVDAQENPLPTILSSRFYEVQKHLTLSRHVYSAFVLLYSGPLWAQLNEAERNVLTQAAREAQVFQRQLNRQLTANTLIELKAKGMQVTAFERSDAERMRNRIRPVLESFHKDIGESTVLDMYVRLSQMRAQQRPKSP
jgi:tripartite ATP-independent transporter DctP family solute receptor